MDKKVYDSAVEFEAKSGAFEIKCSTSNNAPVEQEQVEDPMIDPGKCSTMCCGKLIIAVFLLMLICLQCVYISTGKKIAITLFVICVLTFVTFAVIAVIYFVKPSLLNQCGSNCVNKYYRMYAALSLDELMFSTGFSYIFGELTFSTRFSYILGELTFSTRF